MEGWIKLHRKLLDWEWYEDSNTFRLFIHCLLKANIESKNWKGITIERGQFFTSVKMLATELRLSDKQIRISLNKLQQGKSVAIKGANNGTMITLLKYDSYQDSKKEKGEQKGNRTDNQRATTKELKNNKNNISVTPQTDNKPKSRPNPTIIQVETYFIENGYSIEAAKKAFNYYEAADWHDSNGKVIKNWKQKMIGVWFKPENKQSNESTILNNSQSQKTPEAWLQ